MKTTPLNNIYGISQIALLAAIIACGAYIHVSIGPVPITFQDGFIILAGLILGPFRSILAITLYTIVGIAGFPVFSGGKSGLAHILGPTGGYLIGFFFLAFFSGVGSFLIKKNKEISSVKEIFLAILFSLLGLVITYILGTLWLSHSMKITLQQAISTGVIPFLPFAPVKIIMVVLLWKKLSIGKTDSNG